VTEQAGGRRSGHIVTFYSYKGGTGRTMALANTAWILASNGLRVLAIDWDLESPGLHKYFHPFLRDRQLRSPRGVIELVQGYAVEAIEPDAQPDDESWVADRVRIMNHVTSLDWKFPHGGTIDFVPAGQQEPAYSAKVGDFDWPNFFERLGGDLFLVEVSKTVREEYDYVLIDSRTGLSDIAGICTVVLPDIVVNCFTMSAQSIEGAVAVSATIRRQRRDHGVRLMPVPMRVEEGETRKLEAGRDHIQLQFGPFLDWLPREDVDQYWGDVEVPYKPFYAYEEILAPFGDRSHQKGSLLSAFERLSERITDGRVCAVAPISENDRRRWLHEFERMPATLFSEVLIAYTSVDRPWAEWLAAEVDDAGMRAKLHVIDHAPSEAATPELEEIVAAARYVVAVLSQDYARSVTGLKLWKIAARRDPAGGKRFLVPVSVDAARLQAPLTERNPFMLTGVDESRARELFREALDLPQAGPGDSAARAYRRFPGQLPPVWNVPPRNSSFIGRTSELLELRDRLLASNIAAAVPQVLYGLGGVGKTQIAVEYAHRFAADYDIVWWLPADDLAMARSGMVELATQLNLPTGDSAIKEALESGKPYRHWLLVFDNADDPEQVVDLIPRGAGHVIVTSRNQSWVQHAKAMEIDVFTRQDSVALLRRTTEERISHEDATLVAEKLGDLPLAIDQAGIWLAETGMPVETYLRLLDTQLTSTLTEGRPTGYPATVAATWLVSLDRLTRRTPAAANLLKLCAFFAPEPIPLFLLTAGHIVGLLAAHNKELRNPLQQGRLIREIGRYGLAKPNLAQGSVQMHRLVQAVIRSRLDPDTREANLRDVRTAIIAANPRDPDHAENWPAYQQLWPHVRETEILDSDSPDARQLIIDLVRCHQKRGDYEDSRSLAHDAVGRWPDVSGPDDIYVLDMRLQLANALRAQANYGAAREIDEDVYSRLKRLRGPGSEYTLIAARGLAADLRMVGEYAEACRMEEENLPLFQETFGEDANQTLMATNNLAVSLRMLGNFQKAAELDRDIYQRRCALLGEVNVYTLASASHYGRDLRDVGDLRGSRERLEQTLEAQLRVPGPDHCDTLRTAKNLAITLRKFGEFAQAHELALETFGRLERKFGPRDPETMACQMTLMTTHSALGDHDAARELGKLTLYNLQQVVPDAHVYRLACENNLSIVIRKAGDHGTARTYSEDAVRHIGRSLGTTHPYWACASLNLTNDLRAMGAVEKAYESEQAMYDLLDGTLGEDHIDTVGAQYNLSLSLLAAGDTAAGQPLFDDALARTRRSVGPNNPRLTSANSNRPANFYIEPTPP
jgi:MinD-like ATPase involved in chromosome partitioning or flagellar assembly/tetratricopeptide (TPR) repeat protein